MTDEARILLHRVELIICDLCLNGAGGFCSVPGCVLIYNRAPDIALWREAITVIETITPSTP